MQNNIAKSMVRETSKQRCCIAL